MTVKIIGSALIILACGGFGFSMASADKKETNALRNLIHALCFMECELEYRLTSLPELLNAAKKYFTGSLRCFFEELSCILSTNDQANVQACVALAMKRVGNLPVSCRDPLIQLGKTLGSFGLTGQIEGMKAVRISCEQALCTKTADQDKRLRSYQTLGLCAGAALVILFI